MGHIAHLNIAIKIPLFKHFSLKKKINGKSHGKIMYVDSYIKNNRFGTSN